MRAMAESTESVRISRRLLGTYREWSRWSGRSMRFLLERALQDAAAHFAEGQVAGLKEARNGQAGPELAPKLTP